MEKKLIEKKPIETPTIAIRNIKTIAQEINRYTRYRTTVEPPTGITREVLITVFDHKDTVVGAIVLVEKNGQLYYRKQTRNIGKPTVEQKSWYITYACSDIPLPENIKDIWNLAKKLKDSIML